MFRYNLFSISFLFLSIHLKVNEVETVETKKWNFNNNIKKMNILVYNSFTISLSLQKLTRLKFYVSSKLYKLKEKITD